GQPGVSSNFGFVPEKNLVIAVLTNVSDAPARAIWLEAVNTLLGLPLDETDRPGGSVELTEAQKAQMTGRYTSNEGNYLDVFQEDGHLKGKADGKIFALEARDEATLVILENDKPIRFYVN